MRKIKILSKRKKALIIVGCIVLALLLIFGALFLAFEIIFTPKHKAKFAEGTYVYQGETIVLADDVSIDEVQVSFKKIDKKQFNQANNINVDKNLYDKGFYSIELKVKLLGSSEYLTYSLKYSDNRGRPDLYVIDVTDDNGYYWSIYHIWMWLQKTNEQHVSQRLQLTFYINGIGKFLSKTIFLQLNEN